MWYREPNVVLCDNLDGWDKGEGREAREEGDIYIYIYIYIIMAYLHC